MVVSRIQHFLVLRAPDRAKGQALWTPICSHAPNQLKRHAPAPPFLFKTFPGRCKRSSPQSPDGFASSPLAGQAITFGRAGEGRLAIPLASSFHSSPRLATRREQPGAPAYTPRNFLWEIDRDFVATRYRSASAASSPPMPSSSASTFKRSSGRFGSCCSAGSVSINRRQRE